MKNKIELVHGGRQVNCPICDYYINIDSYPHTICTHFLGAFEMGVCTEKIAYGQKNIFVFQTTIDSVNA
jgi:hypothetical protein